MASKSVSAVVVPGRLGDLFIRNCLIVTTKTSYISSRRLDTMTTMSVLRINLELEVRRRLSMTEDHQISTQCNLCQQQQSKDFLHVKRAYLLFVAFH